MKKILLLTMIMMSAYTLSAQKKPFKFEDGKRKYLIYIPQSYYANQDDKYPLVFNFHGGGMTTVEEMYYTRMNDAADKYHFIVVYPLGVEKDWNVGFDMSYQNGTNDIGFIKALLQTLKEEFRIDEKAIFATGLSRGGFFCHRLASEMPETFAAIASVGGPIPDSVKHFHRSDEKIAVMQVQGTADEIVKYDGKPNAYDSALGTFNYWVKHNKLTDQKAKEVAIDLNQEDGTSVTILEVGKDNTTVSLVTIENGGHTWPGSNPFNLGYPLGKTSLDIDINEVIWEFFDRNRKN